MMMMMMMMMLMMMMMMICDCDCDSHVEYDTVFVFPLVFQTALSLPREDPPALPEVDVLPQAYEMVVVLGRAVG